MKRSIFATLLPVTGCAALLAGLCLPAQAQITPAYKLSDLIAGTSGTDGSGHMLVGDKFFSNWSYSTVGADMPSAANISVQGVEFAGNFGIQFTSLWHANPTLTETASLGYRVAATDLLYISRVHMDGDPTVVAGNGTSRVTENVSDISTHSSVLASPASIFDVVTNNGANRTTQLNDEKFTIGSPSSLLALDVSNAFTLTSGSTIPVPFLSRVEQTFQEAPEPASLILLVAMGVPTMAMRLRRQS